MSCLEPVGGCGLGLWDGKKCRCDCIPPICYDSLFLCASEGSCPDPFAGCTVDIDCPYSFDTSAGDCLSSPTIPHGIFQVFRTRKECCEANYPHSSACGSTSSPTGRPSKEPALDQLSTGGGSLFDGIEEAPALDSEVDASIPVGPIQVGTPEPTIIDAGHVQESIQNRDESSSDGPSAVIGVVVSVVLIGVAGLAFVIWRNRRHKGSDDEREKRVDDDCSSLDGMETSDANFSLDIYNLSYHGQHDDVGPAATRVSSVQQPGAQRIPARRYVQTERSSQNLSKNPALPVPQDPAGRHIHEDDEEEGMGYEGGQSSFYLHESNGDISRDTWDDPEENNDSFGSSSDDGNVLGLLYYAGASSADESEADGTRASRRRKRSKSRSKHSTSRTRQGASTSRSRVSSKRKRTEALKNMPGRQQESKNQSAPTVLGDDGQQTPSPVGASDASTIQTEKESEVDNGTIVILEDGREAHHSENNQSA